jgi:hypothetical protein
MQIADRRALWNVANCVENLILQTVLSQKVAVCRKMGSIALLQPDTVLQQIFLAVIATGCKEPTEETSAPLPIGAVPNTLLYFKLVCAKENLGFVSRQRQEIFTFMVPCITNLVQISFPRDATLSSLYFISYRITL